MNELYLIGRVGAIHDIMIALIVISGLITFLTIIFYLIAEDEGTEIPKSFTKLFKVAITTLIISVIGYITIPSGRELYFIFGVGTAIDYVQSNETAKQLPDKAIKAIDKWLDEKGGE